CDSTGLVFGLMPHPEAIYARWLHPTHTRHNEGDASAALDGWEGDGLQMFRNAVEYVKQRA
ncbi:MAG: phosphoribosylformylglycinamidine synthase subunit PurQ, partial [Candidatus Thermoplasmatota archaeon]|nr:phosphoribosylformylglycinamidine synthase subunit PurQ [Candidatus Thermoplasmatota archaeon]